MMSRKGRKLAEKRLWWSKNANELLSRKGCYVMVEKSAFLTYARSVFTLFVSEFA